jgi:hypothetical protein
MFDVDIDELLDAGVLEFTDVRSAELSRIVCPNSQLKY